MALSAVPVRMVHVSVTGGYTTSAMIDMAYYADLGENPARQISELNRSYGNMVESARKLFYDEVGNSKKNVASSVYFEIFLKWASCFWTLSYQSGISSR